MENVTEKVAEHDTKEIRNVTADIPQKLQSYKAFVTISEAARLVGKQREILYRDLKAGKLSWHLDPDTKKRALQIADLDRVYTLLPVTVTNEKQRNSDKTLHDETSKKSNVTDTLETEVAVLRERLTGKDDIVKRLERELGDLREDRDHWREEHKRMTLLLSSAVQEPSSTPHDTNIIPRPSWLQRLFGK
jgi:hypothetical protein